MHIRMLPRVQIISIKNNLTLKINIKDEFSYLAFLAL